MADRDRDRHRDRKPNGDSDRDRSRNGDGDRGRGRARARAQNDEPEHPRRPRNGGEPPTRRERDEEQDPNQTKRIKTEPGGGEDNSNSSHGSGNGGRSHHQAGPSREQPNPMRTDELGGRGDHSNSSRWSSNGGRSRHQAGPSQEQPNPSLMGEPGGRGDHSNSSHGSSNGGRSQHQAGPSREQPNPSLMGEPGGSGDHSNSSRGSSNGGRSQHQAGPSREQPHPLRMNEPEGRGRGDNSSRGSSNGGRSQHKVGPSQEQTYTLKMDEPGGRGRGRGRPRDDVIVHCRPDTCTNKRGAGGTKCTLIANYYPLESTPNWAMYHYHVDFSPNIEGSRIRRALVHSHSEMLGAYIFDGMALFTAHRLEADELDFFSERKSDNERINIHLKLAKELPPNDPVVLQICNIQMRKNMRYLSFQQLGRHYFDAHDAVAIPQHNLELWPGFTTAIHRFETRVMMCIDMTFKVLRSDSVLDQLTAYFQRNRNTFQADAEKELIGSIVLTRYNNKTYRIDSIDWTAHPSDTFQLKDGSNISFVEYYRKTWSLDINDPRQPMLVSNPKKRDIARGMSGSITLVPELCIMTGISEDTRKNFATMKDLATHTKKDPSARVMVLKRFMDRIQQNDKIKKDMQGWSLAFSRNLVELDGRHLQPEVIYMENNVKVQYDVTTADWTQCFRNNRLFKSVVLRNWELIHMRGDSQIARSFVQCLSRVGPPMGFRVEHSPHISELNSDRAGDYVQLIQRVVRPETQLVICIVPNDRKDRYDAIKKQCCVDNPVASQVIKKRTISMERMLMSVTTKVAIQLNCKLGGAAWAVELPMKNIMVIGYDSYHDSSQRGRTVGGFCCSMNGSLTKWYSRVTFETTHEEMVEGFRTNLGDSLRRYHEINGALPDRVFVFRDGVGEGQLQVVRDVEVVQVMESFKLLGNNYNPKMAFTIVNKRVNTRIMQKNGQNLRNPQPGTVADSEITRPEWYDFFLISQSVRQGTVSPTQYNIIHDTSGLRPDHMQRLTYKLTHLYFNWPGTVTVPAPCMYAHKLAFLTGQSLHNLPNLRLADTLFFL